MNSPHNKEIYRSYDEFGPVQVFDDGNQRQLAFGEGDQQSCMHKAQPDQLHYDYTRAMCLALLFNTDANDALLLGLGAGSLASFLYRQQPQLHITAVELRQLVIDVAYRYFELPRGERLTVINDNALHYLQRTEPADYHFIFSDIYTASGVDDLQLQESYLDMCRECLHTDGWLILNCWREHKADGDLIDVLHSKFSQLYSCTTQSGNWIIFASNSSQQLNHKILPQTAKALSTQVGFNLQSLLKKMQPLR